MQTITCRDATGLLTFSVHSPVARSAPSVRKAPRLRSRLRRPLPCTALTSGNEFPHTMIGGSSGAGGLIAALVLADRRWVAQLVAQQQHTFQQC